MNTCGLMSGESLHKRKGSWSYDFKYVSIFVLSITVRTCLTKNLLCFSVLELIYHILSVILFSNVLSILCAILTKCFFLFMPLEYSHCFHSHYCLQTTFALRIFFAMHSAFSLRKYIKIESTVSCWLRNSSDLETYDAKNYNGFFLSYLDMAK